MSKAKYYVVWAGRQTGVFSSWEECKKQTDNFNHPLYKSFTNKQEAEKAFRDSPYLHIKKREQHSVPSSLAQRPILQSLSVDAACSGNPGKMEYRGVHVQTKEVWFHQAFPLGTNNIGEFLAIVHGLAGLKQKNINIPVYSDSQIAIGWVKKKKCATKLEENNKTKVLFDVIRRAEKWLAENSWNQPLLKWDTANWGEIPADFGRKS
ncbi:MAG: ribonuclease H family protein [Cytophagaceae bacterium]|nr:ribonuclease H family protein [Cytophagaceae bacterium]